MVKVTCAANVAFRHLAGCTVSGQSDVRPSRCKNAQGAQIQASGQLSARRTRSCSCDPSHRPAKGGRASNVLRSRSVVGLSTALLHYRAMRHRSSPQHPRNRVRMLTCSGLYGVAEQKSTRPESRQEFQYPPHRIFSHSATVSNCTVCGAVSTGWASTSR